MNRALFGVHALACLDPRNTLKGGHRTAGSCIARTLGRLTLALVILLAANLPAQGQPSRAATAPLVLVLVHPTNVAERAVAEWKRDGFGGVVLLLEDGLTAASCQEAARRIEAGSLDLFYWIEVGRDARLAEAHPAWMSSLGMHDDWLKLFPGVAPPREGEVAKAFPWVPIVYQEAFEAHLARVERLLKLVKPGYRGILLNHLQSGPSSCGCGNLQCRWATDYHVAATATASSGELAAARFIKAVGQRAPGKVIIPVWTTECEEIDLPAHLRADGRTTGLCGSVGCAVGLCPKEFTRQWTALVRNHAGPVGILALHRELGRMNQRPGPAWDAVAYLDTVLPRHGGSAFPRERLWLVVQGATPEEELTARRVAARAGAGAVIVARVKLEQSFAPRVLKVKQEP